MPLGIITNRHWSKNVQSENVESRLVRAQATQDRHLEASAIRELVKKFPRKIKFKKTPPVEYLFSRIAFGANGCWIWTGPIDPAGYGLCQQLGQSRAHRFSWLTMGGQIPDGMKVLHKCDVRACVNPDHLFIGTQQDNVADMVAKGRNRTNPVFGEESHLSKLTSEKVLTMRETRKTGLSFSKIAKQFGVSTMTAYRAVTGKSWSKA